ncbi:PREDICTED: uncharacterized protein LOC104824500 [Tarenaya hassleriana]|uniref:uncharacterized protein LOC104824500 n=1 Tax=Tarenaya hassleriana TaxID=28532 RepID=UPI00053C9266|nr:PREDICTED: uncharacterized protein LOC104824500 [Tarenaya hassleriana]
MAERRAQEIIWTIQPSVVSDRSRQAIIGFLQGLIKDQFGVEAFPFGSVPLKTYLPDGDIDLTVVSKPGMEKDLVINIYNALVKQGENNPHFPIRHVNYVQAKVKVIKCDVMNISVDISFNQMEGLSALCFFEQVDQLIGRNHMFKRSIILVKAWCYYESRILGAHSGLLSTYAIAVLVLNIINRFHQTLVGPLSVLYKFLDYYGKFDWDNCCVSLDGHVPISSLPNILVEPLNNNLLLDREFLDYCKMLYSIPIQAVEPDKDEFFTKFLNIIDPLKANNNLGRSVAKGSAKRIRFAFAAGAKKLKMVFTESGAGMGTGIEEFFFNSIERNGKGERMDAEVPVNVFGTGKSDASNLSGDFMLHYRSLLSGQLFHGYQMPHIVQHVPRPPLAAHFQDTNAWNIAQRLISRNLQNVPQGPPIIFVPVPLFAYHVPPQQTPTFVPFHNLQTLPTSRGTGTYIPHLSRFANNGHRQTLPVTRDDVRTNSLPIVQAASKHPTLEFEYPPKAFDT